MEALKNLWEKIKEFFKKLKEENKGFGAAMARINSTDFCGNVNRGIKNGDFWEGSYINVAGDCALIYGSNQPDYVFKGEDVESFELQPSTNVTVSKGNDKIPASRYIITFKDGKRAQADLIPDGLSKLKMTLGL